MFSKSVFLLLLLVYLYEIKVSINNIYYLKIHNIMQNCVY